MSLRVEQMAGAGARLLRKAIPARGWRRYAIGSVVVALAASGTVTAVTALPAQAAHVRPARASACKPPASPELAGFKQGNVAVTGDSIHYVIGGRGPVLVLVHGWPITWWEFHKIMPSLAKSFTVIAFDLPGLGNSTVPSSGGFTGKDTATRLHEAIVALGFGSKKISILGHDLGANIAYVYARLYTHSVSREMVLESALNGYGLENLFGFSFHFLFNMQPSTITEGIVNDKASSDGYLNYLYTFVNKPAAITAQDRAVWDGDYACPANREAGYGYYRAFAQDKAWDIRTNTTPLTVEMGAMGGEKSFGGFTAQSFGQVDSNVHTIIAPSSGHYIPEEDPFFLATCASLFFSPNPPVTAPPGFAACLP